MQKMREFGKSTDFGKTAADYGTFRAGFPTSLMDRLMPRGVGLAGQRVLDMGTGTGALARLFADKDCRVWGMDASPSMLDKARELAQKQSLAIEWQTGKAEDIPFDDGFFDVVSAGQCWHWFDGVEAAFEVGRVLKPGGVVLIAHFDWLPIPGTAVAAMEKLVLKYSPTWPFADRTGIYADWFRDLAVGGFMALESFSYDVDVEYSHEAWRGRIRASAGVGATLPPEQVAAFDREHAAILEKDFPGEPLKAPHRVFAIVGRKPFNS